MLNHNVSWSQYVERGSIDITYKFDKIILLTIFMS